MTDRQLEEKLALAVEHAAPDQRESILSRCADRSGVVIPLRKKRPFARMAVAACLALLLVGGGILGFYLRQQSAVASVVSLDVNPSIQLEVSQSEKVLTARALNAEAEEILRDMPLEGTDLNVAVNAIVGSLLRHGYLESLSSAILISVEDADAGRAARLQESLSSEVGLALQNAQSGASVLSQTVAQDASLNSLAQENNVSVGKASLIEAIRAVNSSLSFSDLSALSVEELSQMAAAGAGQLPIGRSEAERIAREYAGVGDTTAVVCEVDAELDERTPHYEVELKLSIGEFEYAVDAYTGQVLRGQAGILAGAGDSGVLSPADIGAEAAKAAALSHAGVSADQVSSIWAKRDYEDGRLEYEVEFWVGSTEYEYEIDAATGQVIGFDHEQDGAESGASTGDIGLEAAKSAALSHAGVSADQAAFTSTKRDYDDGRLEYEIEFWAGDTEYDYEVDGSSGAILKSEAKTHAAASSGDIGAEGARDAALSYAGLSLSDITGLKVERDYDDGRLEYEVEFRSGGREYEVKIDGSSGAILEYDMDDD